MDNFSNYYPVNNYFPNNFMNYYPQVNQIPQIPYIYNSNMLNQPNYPNNNYNSLQMNYLHNHIFPTTVTYQLPFFQ